MKKLAVVIALVLAVTAAQDTPSSEEHRLESISKYGYPKKGQKKLTFEVRMCADAVISLTDGKTTYEVALGANNNTEDQIRCDGSVLTSYVAPDGVPPLDCKIRRPYWISWKKTSLRVGTGNRIGKGKILTYDLSKKFKVTSISVSNGKSKGCWKFGTKCCCIGGGYCKTGTTRCRCPPGLTGKYCHIECPCKNGGKCIGKTTKCKCPKQVFGKYCEWPCPCKNDGQCKFVKPVLKTCKTNKDGSQKCGSIDVKCKCKPNFAGELCEDCKCQNGGTCDGRKCICPPGFYGKKCENACECQNGGSCVDRKCVCPPGFIGKKCEIKIKCCSIWGDPHVMTFDGAKMDFQGDCRYNLMSICPCIVAPQGVTSFSIHMKNWKKGNASKRVSWLKSLDVDIAGTKITLDQEQLVKVNDANATLPMKRVRGARVSSTGRNVKLETEFGASVTFDGRSTATICVPETWGGKTCGICGNFDGVRQNDYITKTGDRLEGIPTDNERAPVVARSWRVMDNPGETCNEAPLYPPEPESVMWKERAGSREFCGLIRDKEGPFSKCISKLNPAKIVEYSRACEFDVIEEFPAQKEAKKMACSSLEAFAGECTELNSHDNNTWRHLTGCEYECPAGMTYSEKMSPCVPTCARPTADEHCTLPETEGCACPEGMLMSGGKCVKPSECGCTDDDGSYFQVRESFFSEDCSEKYVCQPGNETTSSYIETLPGCNKDESCSAVDGVQKCALTPINGEWGEWSGWGDCQRLSGYEGIVQLRTRKCDNPPPKNGGKCTGNSMDVQDCLPADYGKRYEEQVSINLD